MEDDTRSYLTVIFHECRKRFMNVSYRPIREPREIGTRERQRNRNRAQISVCT